jgi:acyl carrier protein
MSPMEIKHQLRDYILENFLFTDDTSQVPLEQSLFDTGTIDSTGVLDLVGFIEETYEVQVDDEEMVPENFDSVAKMAAYVQRKLQAAA